MTYKISNVPSRFQFKESIVNFNDFAGQFIEYMEDLSDRELVKDEIKKGGKNFTSLSDLKKEFCV